MISSPYGSPIILVSGDITCILGCYFHVHFSNAWHDFASHGLPAIAELLVFVCDGKNDR